VFETRAHGAVGDGTTNDAAAIRSAIDSSHAAGDGTVLVPATGTVGADVARRPYVAGRG
jgi:polygalacturonase